MTTQQAVAELIWLAGDLESHLDDEDPGNLRGVLGYAVDRLCELAEDIRNIGETRRAMVAVLTVS